MDQDFKELLINRLKFLEFEGYNSPTMKLISRNNLNPKIYKLKKIFTKNSLMNKQKDLKINLAEYGKKHLSYRIYDSTPVPESLKNLYSDKSKVYKFNKLPSLSGIEYQNLAALRRKKDQQYEHEPVKSSSVEPFKKLVYSKKLKLTPFSPKNLVFNIQKLSPSASSSVDVSKSLDVSLSKRIILSKTKECSVSKDFAVDALDI